MYLILAKVKGIITHIMCYILLYLLKGYLFIEQQIVLYFNKPNNMI